MWPTALLLAGNDKGEASRLLLGALRTCQTAARSSVAISAAQQLQLEVFAQSEIAECAQEVSCLEELDSATLNIRFVKFVIYYTALRPVWWTVLGVSQVVHSYSARQTLDVYALVTGGQDKDESQCNRAAKRLIAEVGSRFRKLVKLREGEFCWHPEPRLWSDTVHDALSALLPVDSVCRVPKVLDRAASIPGLNDGRGFDPAGLDSNRRHAVIHPACFSRLARGLEAELPPDTVKFPHFVVVEDDGPMKPPDSGQGAELQDEEIEDLLHHARRNHRARFPRRLRYVSVHVDGALAFSWDLWAESEVRVPVTASTRSIRLSARIDDEEIPLASHLLFRDDAGDLLEDRLEFSPPGAGRRFEFQLQPPEPGETSEWCFEISHLQEQTWLRLAWDRLLGVRGGRQTLPRGPLPVPGWPQKAGIAFLLILSLTATTLLLQNRSLRRDLRLATQPVVASRLLDLYSLDSRGVHSIESATPHEVRFGEDDQIAVLILNHPSATAGLRCSVKIEDADHRQIYSSKPQQLSEFGSLVLALSRDSLPPGSYRIALRPEPADAGTEAVFLIDLRTDTDPDVQ